MLPRITAILLIAGLATVSGSWAAKKRKSTKVALATKFDYYLLTLSWAPDFCKANPTNHTAECQLGSKLGFVVHGLWPQAETSKGPTCAADGQKITDAIASATMNYIPTRSLMQHEWDSHGTCSGLKMADYFALVRAARDAVKIPDAFVAPKAAMTTTAAKIEEAFAGKNTTLPASAFRATCTSGMLQEARVCFTKDLKGRACSTSAGECSGSMKVLPVR